MRWGFKEGGGDREGEEKKEGRYLKRGGIDKQRERQNRKNKKRLFPFAWC